MISRPEKLPLSTFHSYWPCINKITLAKVWKLKAKYAECSTFMN